MKIKIKKQYIALCLTAVGSAFFFQNCAQKENFGSTNSSSEALQSISLPCTDANGASYTSGQTWQTSQTTSLVVSCSDAANTSQAYLETDHYICSNGAISKTASNSVAVAPMAACPAPVLTAQATAPSSTDPNYELLVGATAVHDVNYSCQSIATSKALNAGNLTVGTTTTPLTNVIEDMLCNVNASYVGAATAGVASTQILTKQVEVDVDCESQGKLKDPTTHQCVEFACKQIVTLAPLPDGSIDVPARTVAGLCYSVKLMSAIEYSPSNLTKAIDSEIISRNHDISDANYQVQHHPYSMGKSLFQFIMRSGGGAREVKLSGSGTAIAPIVIDNFVVVGLGLQSVGLGALSSYHAYGTSDSTVDAASSYVLMNNQQLPLQSFGASGTSTIKALDITTQVSTEQSYSLDVRALDCGGSRQLSDIYLLFE